MVGQAAAYPLEESKGDMRQTRSKSRKSRAAKKDQRAGADAQIKTPHKKSKTLKLVSYVKIHVPGEPSYLQKVVRKRKLREMSERKYG